MTDDRQLAELRAQLVARAGGYFRNIVTEGTCSRCYTPVHGTALCSRCLRDDTTAGLPNARGFMTYAAHHEPIQQSGRVMRDYKSATFQSDDAVRTVSLLAALALRGHRTCPGRLAGSNPTAWAVVPSLPPKPSDTHRLAGILRSLARPRSVEIALCGTDRDVDPRSLSAANFSVRTPVADGAHVLLIDDTWTSGGHAQSAALALRAAGAAHVSVLVLARWLTVGWEATSATWMKTHLTGRDYDPHVCPWTQGECPG